MTDTRLRDLVAQCLVRAETEGEAAVESVCREHPDLASAITRRLAILRGMGLAESSTTVDGPGRTDAAESHPERLGDCRLVERIGGGGMGVVYRAVQEPLGREVALKIVRPELLFFEGSRERFAREVETVANLQHPGIVPVYMVGEADGLPYFTMPLVEGCTLEAVLHSLADRDPGKLTGQDFARAIARHQSPEQLDVDPAEGYVFGGTWERACLRVVRQIADALQHVHERGILHRDIKPSNLIVTPSGRAMLLDFGLASSDGGEQTLTRSSSRLGSLHYMSPEQARGELADLDERSDIYSLGVTLYELLTLRRAFSGDSAAKVIAAIEEGRPSPLRSHHRSLSWEAETVTLTAMEVDLERRYPHAADFSRDMANVLEGRVVEARRTGLVRRIQRWIARHPAAAVAVLLAVVLVVGGPTVYASQERRARADIQAEHRNVLRLSAIQDVNQLIAEAPDLWPPGPALRKKYRDWLAAAEALAAERDDYVAKMRELDARREGGAGDEPGSLSRNDRWWYGQLEELVARLDELVDPEKGLIAGIHPRLGDGIRRRLEFADRIEESSITDAEARRRWEEARAAIAASDRYDGLDLPPQLGLLPMRADPTSGLWEFWVVESGDEPSVDVETARLQIGWTSGIVLVLIPGGAFVIGSQKTDPKGPNYDLRHLEREPLTEGELRPYFIAKCEMTQFQWRRVMHGNPSLFKTGHPRMGDYDTRRHPVEYVSWDNCFEATKRLGLTLPTEAQWENAARAGTSTPWWCGTEEISIGNKRAGNLADRFARESGAPESWGVAPWNDGAEMHAIVGYYEPNPFGLYDTIGNVWEWCREYHLPEDGGKPVRAHRTGHNRPVYAFRGGGFSSEPLTSRVSVRSTYPSDHRYYNIGLRPARLVHGAR